MATNPFEQDWRDCLRAHYLHVAREVANQLAPAGNQASLRGVLMRAGFTEAELDELTIRATMRADDMRADYLPQALAAEEARIYAGVDVPPAPSADAPTPDIVAALIEGEATLTDVIDSIDPVADAPTEPHEAPEPYEPKPKQMSLL